MVRKSPPMVDACATKPPGVVSPAVSLVSSVPPLSLARGEPVSQGLPRILARSSLQVRFPIDLASGRLRLVVEVHDPLPFRLELRFLAALALATHHDPIEHFERCERESFSHRLARQPLDRRLDFA